MRKSVYMSIFIKNKFHDHMSILMQSTILLIHLRTTLQQLKKETITKERKLIFCSIFSTRQKNFIRFFPQ